MEFWELPTDGLTPEEMLKLTNQYIKSEFEILMEKLARETANWVKSYGVFLN